MPGFWHDPACSTLTTSTFALGRSDRKGPVASAILAQAPLTVKSAGNVDQECEACAGYLCDGLNLLSGTLGSVPC